jgi:hypothetical protein
VTAITERNIGTGAATADKDGPGGLQFQQMRCPARSLMGAVAEGAVPAGSTGAEVMLSSGEIQGSRMGHGEEKGRNRTAANRGRGWR